METTKNNSLKTNINEKIFKNKEYISIIKKINIVALAVDLLFIIVYLTFFFILFASIKTPQRTSELENPENTVEKISVILGRTYSYQVVNIYIALAVVFLIFGISLFFLNVRHQRKLETYDYHRWEATNSIIQGFLSLLTLNFVSLALRLIAADLLFRYSEKTSTFMMIPLILHERKEKKERIKALKANESDEEQILIRKKVRKQIVFKVIRYSITYLFLIAFAIFILIPFYWMILTSLKTFQESKASIPSFFVNPGQLQWVNIKFVIESLDFGLYIRNTLIVAVVSTAGTIVTTVLASFAFSKIEFKGRDAIFSVLLMTMMIPGEIYMITNIITVGRQGFGWVGENNPALGYFAAMILPFMTSVFYIFFLRQTFKQIPDSLYKAAKVDGCSDMKFLRRVMIPVAGPTIFTITILSILGTWNAFIWPRIITSLDPINGKYYWLISVALRDNKFSIDKGSISEVMFNLQIAASALVTVPLIIVFLLLRKYIIKGVGRSGTKG